jgi:hypothetical protein
MPRIILILAAFVFVLLSDYAMGPAQGAGAPSITQPDAFKWAPAQGVPPGAQVAVLYGNLSKKGPFAVRFKFPAGYEIPTHSHPTDEFFTPARRGWHSARTLTGRMLNHSQPAHS